jgi:hypothetical protein
MFKTLYVTCTLADDSGSEKPNPATTLVPCMVLLPAVKGVKAIVEYLFFLRGQTRQDCQDHIYILSNSFSFAPVMTKLLQV